MTTFNTHTSMAENKVCYRWISKTCQIQFMYWIFFSLLVFHSRKKKELATYFIRIFSLYTCVLDSHVYCMGSCKSILGQVLNSKKCDSATGMKSKRKKVWRFSSGDFLWNCYWRRIYQLIRIQNIFIIPLENIGHMYHSPGE